MDDTAQLEEFSANICSECGVFCQVAGYPILCEDCEAELVFNDNLGDEEDWDLHGMEGW